MDVCAQKCSLAARRLLLPQRWGKWDPLQHQYPTVTYNDRWFGRGGPIAWPPRSPALTPIGFFLWGHIWSLIYMSPFDSERILLPVLLRQHQPSDSNLAFLSAHVRLFCVVVGCLSRSVAVRLDICSKLVRKTTSPPPPPEYHSGIAWFPGLVRP
jgi:hypothetical protein